MISRIMHLRTKGECRISMRSLNENAGTCRRIRYLRDLPVMEKKQVFVLGVYHCCDHSPRILLLLIKVSTEMHTKSPIMKSNHLLITIFACIYAKKICTTAQIQTFQFTKC